MRNLTKEQKRELRKWADENYDDGYAFELTEKIDHEIYDRIFELNPTEVFYQNANRFLQEYVTR